MNRFEFLQTSLKGMAGLALWTALPASAFGAKALTVQNLIDIILKDYHGEPIPNTNDTIKAGRADMIVSGVVTTMFPTVEVIRKAQGLGVNFIIAHEPTYYNGSDNKTWIADNGQVKLKEELLDTNKLCIWRFHDYCHAMRPDFVMYGVIRNVGWLSYYDMKSPVLTIPETPLKTIIETFKKGLKIDHIRFIGNEDKKCTKVALLPGAWGGQRQMSILNEHKPDVIIVGEAVEWETIEFVRDSQKLGHPAAIVVLGHSVSEEPGMAYFAEWLRPKISGIKVTHVPSNDPFQWR
jgi:putative NIF3 family GTP cyclohydrolase 1 type 2